MKPKNYEKIDPVAQMLVNHFNGKIEDYTLERLTDSFVGITSSMQAKMVKFFIDEYFNFNFEPFTNPKYTGVQHIDGMLVELLKMINDDLEKSEFRH